MSAATSDLGPTRKDIVEVLITKECLPVEMSHSGIGGVELSRKLEGQIRLCHAMIHVVGRCFGKETGHESGKSYTQLERELALGMGMPVHVFLCKEGFDYAEPDASGRELETDEDRRRRKKTDELQEKYRQDLVSRENRVEYRRVANRAELRSEILKASSIGPSGLREVPIGPWVILALVLILVFVFLSMMDRRAEARAEVEARRSLAEEAQSRKLEDMVAEVLRIQGEAVLRSSPGSAMRKESFQDEFRRIADQFAVTEEEVRKVVQAWIDEKRKSGTQLEVAQAEFLDWNLDKAIEVALRAAKEALDEGIRDDSQRDARIQDASEAYRLAGIASYGLGNEIEAGFRFTQAEACRARGTLGEIVGAVGRIEQAFVSAPTRIQVASLTLTNAELAAANQVLTADLSRTNLLLAEAESKLTEAGILLADARRQLAASQVGATNLLDSIPPAELSLRSSGPSGGGLGPVQPGDWVLFFGIPSQPGAVELRSGQANSASVGRLEFGIPYHIQRVENPELLQVEWMSGGSTNTGWLSDWRARAGVMKLDGQGLRIPGWKFQRTTNELSRPAPPQLFFPAPPRNLKVSPM
ncbi:MAG: DUF4062 domain-containing protein [Verrucomicrobiales bacterium]|nr:DUF4062 domain-containing protein [Verrucomicrobiales bacterium]